MAEFDVAHLRIQGVDVVIVFLSQAFDRESEREQGATESALQGCSRQAGLAGNVVLVWRGASGRLKFPAPLNEHPFFRTADFRQLYSQINKKLSCS